ncbi:hypothetical protein H6G96_38625 [Nostoc sp. FACHB-892]|uniref:hypothetical protein n=1 Tax=Nostoc sp. FACHB-892 TaxID=2692843 RepID=UPI001685B031|nr:hypothetical protein [Nostoc sp. FACHB-892]MBD2732019.1 hypothetical protein [Nostoc sp. FACHB-892]
MSTPRFESDVYDGLSGVATSFIPRFAFSAPYYQQLYPASRQGRSSKSQLPSVMRWLMLTSILCNANSRLFVFCVKYEISGEEYYITVFTMDKLGTTLIVSYIIYFYQKLLKFRLGQFYIAR